MKVTYVLPGIGRKEGEKYIGTWKMEPLTIATLKALTPEGIETEFFDDRIELVDYDTDTNLAAITVETYTARRAYEIADRFRARNVPVVMGGYHPTALPEEAAEHCDSVVIGNAEKVWSSVVEDARNGQLKSIYSGGVSFSKTLPDRSIYSEKKYLPLSLVETGRGCVFNCDFCAISSYYKSCYCPRSIDSIVSEIQSSKHKYFFFVDDNIAANLKFAEELCDRITPLKIKWTSQASLTIGNHPELLRKMKKSGCQVLLIGFESLDNDNLNQMKKEWNYKIGERSELIQRIHEAGISIYATFVFGFDFDTKESFEKTLDFSMEHDFFFAAYNHLLPFPATPLYDRLKKEGRLLLDKWWLADDYHYGEIAFHPVGLSPHELSERCAAARRDFFKLSSIFKRSLSLLKRNSDPLLQAIFWSQNLNLRNEVDGKMHIPIGRNMDELPK